MTAQVYDFGDALGAGFAEMMESGRGYQLAVVKFSDIKVSPQIREQMEDETSTLQEMGGSIKQHGILQTMLLRPIPGPIPYELVAGGRRYASATLVGETEGPCLIKEMTDEQKDDIQLAENIQRKNLTQIEEAKKVQRDLDAANGDVEAVMAKHHKGRAWVSKMLGLLKLSDQARRLLSENISADLEVIGKVKAIEKVDPEAAKSLVDELAATRGKEDARKKADAVKDRVKPKAEKSAPADPAAESDTRTLTLPGVDAVKNFADAKIEQPAQVAAKSSAVDARQFLDRAYGLIFEDGASPKTVAMSWEEGERAAVEAVLHKHYHDGSVISEAKVPREIMQGLRDGKFGADGVGAFAMMAFLHGTMKDAQPFDVVQILALAKA
ncbi:ParB/RepB/Spo0J family partition protein [Massilia putida]|uniref:ParB/RepB/Spo0J family partition protein n=1 Tax=Massilia putida TaxID=1141883 RepID=UPI0009529D4F|nr:ParB/RepB/Spo0J family partition protein [Massilia putida]